MALRPSVSGSGGGCGGSQRIHRDGYRIRDNAAVVNVGNGEQATHHKFTEAPIFNFVYTAEDYTDRLVIPKIDYNYELFYVAAIVNSNYFRSFTKRYVRLYLGYKIANIKSKFKK